MKKLILAAIALIAMVAGFGALPAPSASANPTNIYVINDHVGAALTGETVAMFDTNLTTNTGRTTVKTAVPFATIETASGDQVPRTAAAAVFAGTTYILALTDGSVSNVTLNGRGLTCAPVLCDGVAAATPDPTDNFIMYKVIDAGTHSVSDTFTATATQDAIQLDSTSITVVGQAQDMALSLVNNQTTLQAGATACTETQATGPNTARALVTYTDINADKLTGYNPVLSSSSSATLAVGSPGTFPQASSPPASTTGTLITMVQSDANVGAEDAICGNAASTIAITLTATATAGEIGGFIGTVTRTAAITVTGVPAEIVLTASPASIACDGTQTSTVTAQVFDSAANPVVDGTPVTFSVVALGTANPINTTTTGGSASSTITPLAASEAGVTIVVTAGTGTGSVQASILVSCNRVSTPTPTSTATPIPTATTTATPTATPGAGDCDNDTNSNRHGQDGGGRDAQALHQNRGTGNNQRCCNSKADSDDDGHIDFRDLIALVRHLGTQDVRFDLNNDGKVNVKDVFTFLNERRRCQPHRDD